MKRIVKIINGNEVTEDENGDIFYNGLYVANIKDSDYMEKIHCFADRWAEIHFCDGDLYDD